MLDSWLGNGNMGTKKKRLFQWWKIVLLRLQQYGFSIRFCISTTLKTSSHSPIVLVDCSNGLLLFRNSSQVPSFHKCAASIDGLVITSCLHHSGPSTTEPSPKQPHPSGTPPGLHQSVHVQIKTQLFRTALNVTAIVFSVLFSMIILTYHRHMLIKCIIIYSSSNCIVSLTWEISSFDILYSSCDDLTQRFPLFSSAM